MSTSIDKGFILKTIIQAIDTVKPRKADSFKNDDGDVIDYGFAVKFKTRNIEMVQDDDWGEKEKEVTFEIEVPCDNMMETKQLNNWLKDRKKDNKPFELSITLPTYSNGFSSAKSLLKGSQVMALIKK